jgi:hypothetical protein
MKIDICIDSETKNKLKGTMDLKGYMLRYSWVLQNKRAASGVEILLKQLWRNIIYSCNFVGGRTDWKPQEDTCRQ